MTASAGETGFRPLRDVHVLNVSALLAGLHTGRVLADLGADVVTVEAAPEGSPTRRRSATDVRLGSLIGLATAGTRSLCIDPGSERAVKVFSDLARWADVIVASGDCVLEHPDGPTVASLANDRAAVITCYVTPLGRGELSRMVPGFPTDVDEVTLDGLLQALVGTAYATGDPDGPPRLNASGLSHTQTAIHAAIAIVHALRRRRLNGEGEELGVSLLDTALFMDAEHAPLVAAERGAYQANRTGHVGDVDTLAIYRGRDGFLVMEVWGQGADSMWGRLATVIDRPDLVDDTRFRDDQERMRHWDELHPIIEEWIQSFPTIRSALDRLLDARLVCGLVVDPRETTELPQVRSRNMLRPLEESSIGRLSLATPYRLSEATVGVGPVPSLGQHSSEVLQTYLGYDRDDVTSLVANGTLVVSGEA